jgi:hypothetical protein
VFFFRHPFNPDGKPFKGNTPPIQGCVNWCASNTVTANYQAKNLMMWLISFVPVAVQNFFAVFQRY